MTTAGANLIGANLIEKNFSGANFSGADLSGANLIWANLSAADLSRANLSGAKLSGANLGEADLSGANLSETNLSGANLIGANLIGAKLSGDLPMIPNIHTTLYEAASKPQALCMSEWYMCGTTHCRAGWVIMLAGERGKKLEAEIGTNAAAALIYYASDPTLPRVPDWYATDTEALQDMRQLADRERELVD